MKPSIAVVVYLAAIATANLAVAMYGPSITVIDAFLFIGLDLTLRDSLHEAWHGRTAPMIGLIALGGLLSWLVNSSAGMIAVASTASFVLAALADYGVYTLLGRHPKWLRVNGSNIAGSAVDSLAFPTVAFGSFLPLVVAGQFVAKVIGGLVWYGLLAAPRRLQARTAS